MEGSMTPEIAKWLKDQGLLGSPSKCIICRNLAVARYQGMTGVCAEFFSWPTLDDCLAWLKKQRIAYVLTNNLGSAEERIRIDLYYKADPGGHKHYGDTEAEAVHTAIVAVAEHGGVKA